MGKQATPTLVRANNALGKARMTPSRWIFKLVLHLKFKQGESLDIAFQNTKQKESGNTELVKKTLVSGDKWAYERG